MITVSYTSCFWAQLYDGHGCGGQDRSRTCLCVHCGGSWKLSSGTDAPSNWIMSRKSKLEVEKKVLLQFSKFEMANVLATDCILETDLFSIWYKKLHMWWNLGQILARIDGFHGLSWLLVPRIEHWARNCTCPPVQIWTWKCVLLLFPKKFEMAKVFLLIVFQIQVCMAFDTRSCACGGILPEFWFILMV